MNKLKWISKEYAELLKIEPMPAPAPLPFGFFDKKGRFCSIRNKQRKFLKNLRDISGVNEELMGSAET